MVDLLAPSYTGLDVDSWGLDHGAWSVLAHVLPRADVPVVQLSLHAEAPPQYHFDIGRKLAPLRKHGVLVLGSGNVVHNLRRMNRAYADQAFDWGQRFDAEVERVMTGQPREIVNIGAHPDYALSAPTAEHFMPLYYLAGLCDAAGEAARPFAQGAAMGSLTMTSYTLGLPQAPDAAPGDGAADMPRAVPPEQTNT